MPYALGEAHSIRGVTFITTHFADGKMEDEWFAQGHQLKQSREADLSVLKYSSANLTSNNVLIFVLFSLPLITMDNQENEGNNFKNKEF